MTLIGDASRRQLLDGLRWENGLTLSELCKENDRSRQAVTKHLFLLEAANLIVTVKQGREKLHNQRTLLSFRGLPLKSIRSEI
jgi:predicted transcriptional regulator